jgi:SprT protein
MQLDFFARLKSCLRPLREPQPPLSAIAPAHHPDDAQTWLAQAQALLRGIGCEELAARVQVRWNPRMRSTAGTAYPGRALVLLNPRLREFGEEEVDRTLRHELAHLLAHHRAGRRRIAAHGAEWQRACVDLGLRDEKRCHDLPLPRRKLQRRHAYRCPACQVTVERVRPLRRGAACLACCRAHNGGRYDEQFRFVKVARP